MRSEAWDELDRPVGPRPPRESGPRSHVGAAVLIGLGLIVFALVALSTMVDGPRPTTRLASCLSNVKQLQQAALMYEKDYSRLPDGSRWCDEIMPYVPHEGVFRCPSGEGPGDYAINSAVAGMASSAFSDPAAVPSVFDAASGWNQQGGAADVVFRHRLHVGTKWSFSRDRGGAGDLVLRHTNHVDYASMAFVDGHVKIADASAIAGLTWTLKVTNAASAHTNPEGGG